MRSTLMLAALGLAACGTTHEIGVPPQLTPKTQGAEHRAMMTADIPRTLDRNPRLPGRQASLWNLGQASLLGDRRAMQTGDIMTVVIEINDKAEISNSSKTKRSGSEQMGVTGLFGLPQRANAKLPEGASMDKGVELGSTSSSSGDGSTSRNEKVTLRIAATITGVMPNGVLNIEGQQQVRVNNEMRDLTVSGFVRPQDVSRQNEITYDKIASARISYGGKGQITDVQQPRYGQQILDAVLPF